MAEKNPTTKELQATIDIMEESMIETIEDVREELLDEIEYAQDQIIDANDSYALLERDVDDLKQEVRFAYDRLDSQLKMICNVEAEASSSTNAIMSLIALSLSIVSLIASIIALNG